MHTPASSASSASSTAAPFASRRASTYSPDASDTTESSTHDHGIRDVAIVGMACRVAGGNNTPDELWQSLLDRKDASGEMPAGRWEAYHRRDPRNPDVLAQTTSRGYYLDNLEDFDARFFGISPMEAEQMDPQQRISLEVAYEALENAGIATEKISGSDTAVFWGVNSDDYSKLVLEDVPNVDAWMGIGTAYCGVPNRISYHFNLLGPSSAVDAACASSLVAVHHGVQAILAGESKMAIVGGVNALCGPGLFRALDRAGALSPEGKCQSFDDDAHGYGRGEGAAALVLKDLSQAMLDQDDVLAVIKGSAVAHDGKTNGIMAPNSDAQARVCSLALKAAGINPLSVGYVEAHATSTPLGDPTEISALASIYGAGRDELQFPCLMGSIKPNIGHLEAGAGAIGLIKAVMAVRKGLIPPQANLHRLTTRVDWNTCGLQVAQALTKWPDTYAIRRAAVSSYGYGGTVAHAVIEEFSAQERFCLSTTAEKRQQNEAMQNLRPTYPLVILLSGRDKNRLPLQARQLSQWLGSVGGDCHGERGIQGVASTLAHRRDHMDYRAAFIFDSRADAIHLLSTFAEGSGHPWLAQGRRVSHFDPANSNRNISNKDIVWIFSGHGAHWSRMGKELLNHPVFRVAVEPLDRIVLNEIGLSPITLLRNGDSWASDEVQLLTYVMQIGISAVLRSLGIVPAAVIGHSVGEIAASVVAGALTPDEGAIIVTRRAVLYRELMGQGGMALVNEPFEVVAKELERGHYNRDAMVVAAIDASPSSCVISGHSQAVSDAAKTFKDRGVKVFTVKTDIAFHSPMLEPLVAPLLKALDGCCSPTLPTRAKLYSTSLLDARGQDLRDSSYWADNMINPVRLQSAIQAATQDSYRVFMEVSSHPLVSQSVTETIMEADIDDYLVTPTLMRDKPAEKCILLAAAQLHCRGISVNWPSQMSGPWAKGVPNTPWVHRPTWRKVETSSKMIVKPGKIHSHTLLGESVSIAGTDTTVYSATLDQSSKPFPLSHPVQGTEIIPAACLLNTFLKAKDANILQDVVLRVPLAVSGTRSIQVVSQRQQVSIISRLVQSDEDEQQQDSSSWVTHTTAEWKTEGGSAVNQQTPLVDFAAIKSRIGMCLSKTFTIDYLKEVGVSAMGFPWVVEEHHGNSKEMLALVCAVPDLPNRSERLEYSTADRASWAPILDAATSIGSTLFFEEPRLRMPAQVQRVRLFTNDDPPTRCWIHVQQATDLPFTCHIYILNEAGQILVKLTAMRFSEIEGSPGVGGSIESLVHQVAWVPMDTSTNKLPITKVILICPDVQLRETYAATIPSNISTMQISSVLSLVDQFDNLSLGDDSVLVYIPGNIDAIQDVAAAVSAFTWQLLEAIKFLVHRSISSKLFVVTCNASKTQNATALAHASLLGLSRVLASEHPDQFGGAIDCEELCFPLSIMQNTQTSDVIRICGNGVPTVARLQRLPRDRLAARSEAGKLLPRPQGTYLITGGLGALGLQVAAFLVAKGARRLILVSRRRLPPRQMWGVVEDEEVRFIVTKIQDLEAQGASVHPLSLDISASNAALHLLDALERLAWPPVLGVVHAAGVLDNQLAMDTTQDAFSNVLAPKVDGGLALHEAFPPGSVDFFILFSSCGQLVGFTGQSSYGSANAFLDGLATYRRHLGDCAAVSFLWTSWRGMGMGASTKYIEAELESKGITDVTSREAFEAWEHLSKFEMDHGVVLRSLVFDQHEELPSSILNDIAIRRQEKATDEDGVANAASSQLVLPESPAELKPFLVSKICGCVAQVLHMDAQEVDPRAALSDLGVDSVITVSLRRLLQQTLRVKVPPTLTWSHPTVDHLGGWFEEKLATMKI